MKLAFIGYSITNSINKYKVSKKSVHFYDIIKKKLLPFPLHAPEAVIKILRGNFTQSFLDAHE